MMNLNLKINTKAPHPPYKPGSSFWWDMSATHPVSTYKPRNNLHLKTKFVESVINSIKNESFFFRESSPVIALRCFIDETPLLKLPKRSLADRA